MKYTDPDGKKILLFVLQFTMNTGSWSTDNLKDTTEKKYQIQYAGCAVTAGANFTATIHLNDITQNTLDPGEINESYCSDGMMNWSDMAKDYGFTAKRGYGQLSDDFN